MCCLTVSVFSIAPTWLDGVAVVELPFFALSDRVGDFDSEEWYSLGHPPCFSGWFFGFSPAAIDLQILRQEILLVILIWDGDMVSGRPKGTRQPHNANVGRDLSEYP